MKPETIFYGILAFVFLLVLAGLVISVAEEDWLAVLVTLSVIGAFIAVGLEYKFVEELKTYHLLYATGGFTLFIAVVYFASVYIKEIPKEFKVMILIILALIFLGLGNYFAKKRRVRT